MKTQALNRSLREPGYALLLVMVFTAVSLSVLSGAMIWTSNNSRFTDRNIQYYNTLGAAEAATEKILSAITRDYKLLGEATVYSKLGQYVTNVPSSSEWSYWSNYEFSNGSGTQGRSYIDRSQPESYVPLESQYSGLNGYASRYRVLANVRQTNTSHTNITVALQQDVQLASIPIFQFAIFYQTDAEFTSAAPLYIRGRVHSNSSIFTGSASPLVFYADVTSVGTDMSVARYGYSSFGGELTFYGQKDTNVSTLSLPIGTNNTSAAVREVLNLPPSGESPTSTMGKQRYYNKAEITILFSNSTTTVTTKTPFASSGNSLPWANNVNYFVSTNKTFTDQRQNKTMLVTEIDIGKLSSWAATNSTISSTLGSGVKPNLLYIRDYRTMTSSQLPAVRIVNAAQLPARGLTVATPHSLYTQGTFNQPNSAYFGTTNTTTTLPASLISDAYTLLSSAWDDSLSGGNYADRNPTDNTTVNAAILAGNVPSGAEWSGGVHNLPRLLEDWSGRSYTLNGSLVCLYASTEATAQFQWPGAYYSAPTRKLSFDPNFTDPAKLPPGTPELRTLVRARWTIPPANTTTYAGW